MNREDLNELIRQEITNAAFEALKDSKKEPKQNANEPKPYHVPGKTLARKELSEKEIDTVMFGEPKKNRQQSLRRQKQENKKSTIMEGTQPQISATEVDTFEKDFHDLLANVPNTTVTFDKQPRDPKKRSVVLIQRPDGIEAIASGIITIGDKGTIKWNFSIYGGIQVETQGKLTLEKETKFLFDNLYSFYIDWQTKWKKITTSGSEDAAPEMDAGADMGGEVAPDVPMQDAQAGTPEATSL